MEGQQSKARARRWVHAVAWVSLFLIMTVLTGPPAAAQEEPGILTIIKRTTPARGQDFDFIVDAGVMEADWTETIAAGLIDPRGMAATPIESGVYLYIVDAGRFKIHKLEYYEPDFLWEEVGQWGGKGTGNGKFLDPVDIAIDNAGNVYVTDAARADVQKFDADGNFLAKFGGKGSGDGQFQAPSGIAVYVDGRVFVADTTADRIQVFDGSGSFLDKFGSPGTGEGQFAFPLALDVDSSGNLYVADRDQNRIQVFDSEGAFLRKWGTSGTGPGQFSAPAGLLVANLTYPFTVKRDLVYVTDASGRSQVFDARGLYLGQWGSDGNESPKARLATGIADCLDGPCVAYQSSDTVRHFYSLSKLAVGLDDGDAIQPYPAEVRRSVGELVPEGWTLADIACTGGEPQRFGNSVRLSPGGLEISCAFHNEGSAASLTVVNDAPTTGALRLPFTIDPAPLTLDRTWGDEGTGDGQFLYPVGVALDGGGNLYIADGDRNEIQKFNSQGQFLEKFGGKGSGNGQFQSPTSIAAGAGGRVYVTDNLNYRVQYFNTHGDFMGKWGSLGEAEGQFAGSIKDYGPLGVTVDGRGDVYVTDGGNHRVQKFDAGGRFLLMWGWGVRNGDAEFQVCTAGCRSGLAGSGDGQFSFPHYIATDSRGRVFVSNNARRAVQIFGSGGAYLGQLDPGEPFFWETRLAVDRADNVYVYEYHIQKFDRDGHPLGHSAKLPEYVSGSGIAVTGDGTIYALTDRGAQKVRVYGQDTAELADGESKRIAVAPGTYSINALLPEGWFADSITCTGGKPRFNGAGVRVTLAAGADVTCTFHNRRENVVLFAPLILR